MVRTCGAMLPRMYVNTSVNTAKLRNREALILWPRIIAMGSLAKVLRFALNALRCRPFPLKGGTERLFPLTQAEAQGMKSRQGLRTTRPTPLAKAIGAVAPVGPLGPI